MAEKQLWRPSVRSYTLNTAGMPAIFLLGGRGGGVGSRSEDKDGIFEGKSLELKRRERSARTDRALFFTVKGQGQHPEAALVISHVATFLSFLN